MVLEVQVVMVFQVEAVGLLLYLEQELVQVVMEAQA
jgi:hypothetical protein